MPNYAHDHRQFIESLALAIAHQKNQMPLLGTLGTPVFGGADVTNFIEAYKCLSSRTWTNLAADDLIATVLYFCLETILEMIKMMNGYLRKDWVHLKEEVKDGIEDTDSRVYLCTRSYLEWLCRDPQKLGNVGLKSFILAYDIISCIMINQRALAKYSQVVMLLGDLPRELTAKEVTKLELDCRDPWTV